MRNKTSGSKANRWCTVETEFANFREVVPRSFHPENSGPWTQSFAKEIQILSLFAWLGAGNSEWLAEGTQMG
jgi:hypothetical protein